MDFIVSSYGIGYAADGFEWQFKVTEDQIAANGLYHITAHSL